MKKFVCAILTMVMVLSVAAIASAATAGFTIYNVPCKDIGNDQIYQYHGDRYVVKRGTDHIVQIKHRVTQTSAVENNRIAAYCRETGKTMGIGWKPADNTYYPINSAAIVTNRNYTAAGRGNTNYKDKYGLSSVTITGVINSYDD